MNCDTIRGPERAVMFVGSLLTEGCDRPKSSLQLLVYITMC